MNIQSDIVFLKVAFIIGISLIIATLILIGFLLVR